MENEPTKKKMIVRLVFFGKEVCLIRITEKYQADVVSCGYGIAWFLREHLAEIPEEIYKPIFEELAKREF